MIDSFNNELINYNNNIYNYLNPDKLKNNNINHQDIINKIDNIEIDFLNESYIQYL
jgi:hypothetical protein